MQEASAVYNVMSIIENMIEVKPEVAELVLDKTKVGSSACPGHPDSVLSAAFLAVAVCCLHRALLLLACCCQGFIPAYLVTVGGP